MKKTGMQFPTESHAICKEEKEKYTVVFSNWNTTFTKKVNFDK